MLRLDLGHDLHGIWATVNIPNLQAVIQNATKYSDILGPVKLIEIFKLFKSFEGKFSYTFSSCPYVTNPPSKGYIIASAQQST